MARDQTQHSRLAALAASRDELTGAFSERQVFDTLAREMARAKRLAAPLSIARVDIDKFSAINLAHGFATGDAVLAHFAAMANEVARHVDSLGRIGGTEFLLLLPDTPLENAHIAAERLRAIVAQSRLPELPADTHITCSIGIAQYMPDETLVVLFERAESGLNLAKATGRNRVVTLAADGRPLEGAGKG
jgi:diguanylate cyclase (GGDEF)-like protein